MINKQNITIQLLKNALDCGYLDVEFLVDTIHKVENKKFKIKGKEDFLFYVDKEGTITETLFERLEDAEIKPEINALIYELFSLIMERINELYELELEAGTHYEIYTNCLDSHLSLINEDETLNDEEQQIKDEIKAIVEEFN